MKIYTKTGDKGTTSLFGGARLNKDDIRIESYGTVDELNSHLGLLIASLDIEESKTQVQSVQNILFVIGSHLATASESDMKLPTIPTEGITDLEQAIDQMESELPPLKSFILPGGSKNAGICHVCRTVCRRAERRCVTLSLQSDINVNIVIYLNRLSDYLFVLSRYICLKEGADEIPWIP